jgi:hypothetical protein
MTTAQVEKDVERSRFRHVGVGLVVASYLVSFVLPAARFESPIMGWEAFADALLLWWWVGLLGWLPNPLLWLGVFWLLDDHPGRAAFAGLAGLLCGLVWVMFLPHEITLLAGYYLWLESMCLLAVVGTWKYVDARTGLQSREELEEIATRSKVYRAPSRVSGNGVR